MNAPFVYGRIATDENFINREAETINLVGIFVSLSNTTSVARSKAALVKNEVLDNKAGVRDVFCV